MISKCVFMARKLTYLRLHMSYSEMERIGDGVLNRRKHLVSPKRAVKIDKVVGSLRSQQRNIFGLSRITIWVGSSVVTSIRK